MSYLKTLGNIKDQLDNTVDDVHNFYAEKEMELHKIIFELDKIKQNVATSDSDTLRIIESIQEKIKDIILSIHRENN